MGPAYTTYNAIYTVDNHLQCGLVTSTRAVHLQTFYHRLIGHK